MLFLRGYGDYVECPGVYYINFKNGYESFVRQAVQLLPEKALRVNSPVSRIHWKTADDEKKHVTLELVDGTVLSCDHVILTQSVEVLKQFSFDPPLPLFKTKVIDGTEGSFLSID